MADDKEPKVAIASDRGVKPWRPLLPRGATLAKSRFAEWFLVKLLNAERAAMYASQFHVPLTRTARKNLDEWVEKFGPK